MLRDVPGLSVLLVVLALIAACETAPSRPQPTTVVAVPPLARYSQEFLDRASSELEAEPPSCDRLEPAGDCSAPARMVEDYGDLRARVRAMGEEPAGQ